MKNNRMNHKILSIVVICLCILSAISIGFSSWNISYSYVAEANMELVVDDVTGNFVQFKDIKLDNSVIRFDANEDINGNVTMGKDGKHEQLECKIIGTIEKYSTLKEINAYVSADSHYEQTWNSIYKKGYFEVPRFMTLSRTSSSEDSLEDICSYWTSDYDSSKNSRSFCMRSSFTWGRFFNYMNPCDFFDSYDSNGIKRGIEYTQQEKKTVLKELKTLDGSKFIVELRSKPITYEVYVDYNDNIHGVQKLDNAEKNGVIYFPDVPSDEYSPAGGTFIGWKIDGINSDKIYQASETINIESLPLENTNEITLKAQWDFSAEIHVESMTITVSEDGSGDATSDEQNHKGINITLTSSGGTLIATPTFSPKNVSDTNISINNQDGKTNTGKYTYTKNKDNSITININSHTDPKNQKYIYIRISSNDNSNIYVDINITLDEYCILPTALILMADGTYKQAGLIKTGDMVMSFNHETGKIEPNVVIGNDDIENPASVHNVVHLEFANGKSTDFVYEHGYFDKTLNQYVYLHENDSNNYIGHEFVFIENGKITTSKLIKTSVSKMLTKLAAPATANHLNLIVDDMLSMEGGLTGLFNIFEYNPDTLAFDYEKMQQDIDKYGLLGYEYFEKYFPEEIYNLLPCKYLGVSIGKGLITWDVFEGYVNKWKDQLLENIK